jgi:predicted enzyme related to lactoylglutathione lyase
LPARIAPTKRDAAEACGKVERSKTGKSEHGFVTIVEDTEGNQIGLHSSA